MPVLRTRVCVCVCVGVHHPLTSVASSISHQLTSPSDIASSLVADGALSPPLYSRGEVISERGAGFPHTLEAELRFSSVGVHRPGALKTETLAPVLAFVGQTLRESWLE